MQLYDIAIGSEMIRPYLLSVECAAAPQPREMIEAVARLGRAVAGIASTPYNKSA